MSSLVPPETDDLPPSAKLVAAALATADRPLTHGDLQDRTRLPDRSLRYALERLRDAGLVDEDVHLPDPRAREYSLDV